MNTLYIYTSPSNKKYVGVTTRYRRRMWEHKHSNTPFGKALRKYGEKSFKVELRTYEDIEDAYIEESKLIQEEQVLSDSYYNQCVGGRGGNVTSSLSPSKKKENRIKRSLLMKTDFNPMSKEDIRLKHKEAVNQPEYIELQRQQVTEAMKDPVRYAQALKGLKIANATRANKVLCDNVCFYSVADAASYCNITRSTLRDRIRSENPRFINFRYIE